MFLLSRLPALLRPFEKVRPQLPHGMRWTGFFLLQEQALPSHIGGVTCTPGPRHELSLGLERGESRRLSYSFNSSGRIRSTQEHLQSLPGLQSRLSPFFTSIKPAILLIPSICKIWGQKIFATWDPLGVRPPNMRLSKRVLFNSRA